MGSLAPFVSWNASVFQGCGYSRGYSITIVFVGQSRRHGWLIPLVALTVFGSACQASAEDPVAQTETAPLQEADSSEASVAAASQVTTTESGDTSESQSTIQETNNSSVSAEVTTTSQSTSSSTASQKSATSSSIQAATSTATNVPATTTTLRQPASGTTTTTASTSTTTTVASSNDGWDEDLLEGLVVSNSSAPVSYDRDDWGSGWSDADGDCMNARHEVLKTESVDQAQVSSSGCTVTGGRWYGAFTGTWVTNPSSLDIDHFVPLANAHGSGGWAWSAATKRKYYNDLSDPKHLIAVTASANRSKGSRGPENWKPTNTDYWCVYAHTWATIKTQWELTVTTSELADLTSMLSTCDAEPASTWTPPAAPATTSSSTTSSSTTTTGLANPGNTKNCSDFSSYGEAKEWFDRYFPLYGDVAGLDNDNDGEPCESLPGGPTTTTSTTTTTITTTTTSPPTTTTIPANPGNTKNCSDFSTYAEAKAWFDTYFPHYGDVARLDSDGDGEPCESLPGGP